MDPNNRPPVPPTNFYVNLVMEFSVETARNLENSGSEGSSSGQVSGGQQPSPRGSAGPTFLHGLVFPPPVPTQPSRPLFRQAMANQMQHASSLLAPPPADANHQQDAGPRVTCKGPGNPSGARNHQQDAGPRVTCKGPGDPSGARSHRQGSHCRHFQPPRAPPSSPASPATLERNDDNRSSASSSQTDEN